MTLPEGIHSEKVFLRYGLHQPDGHYSQHLAIPRRSGQRARVCTNSCLMSTAWQNSCFWARAHRVALCELSDVLPKVDSMRKRVALAAFLTFGCVLLGLAAANFFPDQTWRALTMARTLYEAIVSRITPMASGGDRHIQRSPQTDLRDQPCDVHMSNEVDQIFANAQAFVHRIATIRGRYFSGFEISSLVTCANGHWVELWVESSSSVVATAKLNEHLPSRERQDSPILRFKFDEQKNAAAWRKLESQAHCSDVTLVGQFETNRLEVFGHLGAYKHELILLDVLSSSWRGCAEPLQE